MALVFFYFHILCRKFLITLSGLCLFFELGVICGITVDLFATWKVGGHSNVDLGLVAASVATTIMTFCLTVAGAGSALRGLGQIGRSMASRASRVMPSRSKTAQGEVRVSVGQDAKLMEPEGQTEEMAVADK